jgi:hypothetical protein
MENEAYWGGRQKIIGATAERSVVKIDRYLPK